MCHHNCAKFISIYVCNIIGYALLHFIAMVSGDNNSIQSPMRRAICKEVGTIDEPCQDIIQETEGTPFKKYIKFP